MYKDDVALSMFGGLAAGVPGEVRGLGYIHAKYGVGTKLALSRKLILTD